MDNLVAEANCTTGEVVHRPMTADEIKADEIHRQEEEKKESKTKAATDKAATDKAALLIKLGLTADEAKLLLS